jgi:hypothetical protein
MMLGLSLIALSAFVYLIHFFIFRDAHHIFIYMVGDIAFVFFEVLLVTLIIHRLLSEREKRSRLEKLNMVIGTFFSEVGTKLITYFSDFDPNLEQIKDELKMKADWSDRDFDRVSARLKKYDYQVDFGALDRQGLKDFLMSKRAFLLRLLENPNLLEHETFTDLLRAVFHLTEELHNRDDVSKLLESDSEHLSGDVKRAYVLLVQEWWDYMRYLKDNYPYLYSLAIRTNPFDEEASPIVA